MKTRFARYAITKRQSLLAALCAAISMLFAPCRAPAATPVVTISGQIDGSDSVELDATSATWTHTLWNAPSNVLIDGVPWNTASQATISPGGNLLPSNLADYLVTTTVLSGRDVAVARPDAGHVLLQFADTPNGTDNYSVQISFTPKPPPISSPTVTLHLAANIDGSDLVHISASGATWVHRQWGAPTSVTLDGTAWDTVSQPTIANSGTTTFLPAGIDFSTAVMTEELSRDVASYQVFSDHVDVVFADNQLGAGLADITLQFGSAPEPQSLSLLALGALGLCFRQRGPKPAKRE